MLEVHVCLSVGTEYSGHPALSLMFSKHLLHGGCRFDLRPMVLRAGVGGTSAVVWFLPLAIASTCLRVDCRVGCCGGVRLARTQAYQSSRLESHVSSLSWQRPSSLFTHLYLFPNEMMQLLHSVCVCYSFRSTGASEGFQTPLNSILLCYYIVDLSR